MKKTLLLGGLAVLTMTVGAGVAVAQQAAPERPARAMRADVDQDGRLSRAEFVDRRVERLAAVDADRDGSVTREEMQAAGRARMAQRADARFERLDANDDGSISRAEFDAGREARAERAPRPMRAHRAMGGGRGHRMMMRGARMEARGPIAIADVQARAGQMFDRMDGDNDGYVTAEERRAAGQAMREQRRAAREARRASPQAPASE